MLRFEPSTPTPLAPLSDPTPTTGGKIGPLAVSTPPPPAQVFVFFGEPSNGEFFSNFLLMVSGNAGLRLLCRAVVLHFVLEWRNYCHVRGF